MRVCCVCGSDIYLCAGTPHSLFFFILFALFAACCCCHTMPTVSHRVSSSRALYFVAATVQKESHSKFVWTTSMRVRDVFMQTCGMCNSRKRLIPKLWLPTNYTTFTFDWHSLVIHFHYRQMLTALTYYIATSIIPRLRFNNFCSAG